MIIIDNCNISFMLGETFVKTDQRYFAIIMIIVLIIFMFRRRNPELVKPTGVISGTCTGPDGKVVAGAKVTLTDANSNVVASVDSGADGSYALPPVTLGNYHISAVLANPDGTHLQGDADVVLSSATQTVDLAMACFFV
jgi:hypothetical protein